MIKARDGLVQVRTKLVNQVRGITKSFGHRLVSCSARSFAGLREEVLELLRAALDPLFDTLEDLTRRIKALEEKMDALAQTRYPETQVLTQVAGVGTLTATAFVLTLEDPERFRKSRTVGAFLGLTPARSQSGQIDPQLRISKQGDSFLRRLLVTSSQYILGPFGKDCDLRRYGERIACRGGKRAKKRAVVAVARKLAVLLHALWRTGAEYDPFYSSSRQTSRTSAALPGARLPFAAEVQA